MAIRWPRQGSSDSTLNDRLRDRRARCDRGDALFFYKGQRGVAPVIFGDKADATLLGAVTLESLGFVLDAIRRDLLPLPMVVARSAADQSYSFLFKQSDSV